MNKSELIQVIASTSGESKAAVDRVLDKLGNIVNNLQAGEELVLPGIGKLKAVAKAGRTARNPQTGAAIEIAPSVAIKLVPSKSLKENLNR